MAGEIAGNAEVVRDNVTQQQRTMSVLKRATVVQQTTTQRRAQAMRVLLCRPCRYVPRAVCSPVHPQSCLPIVEILFQIYTALIGG
jgi:hypothetical protein